MPMLGILRGTVWALCLISTLAMVGVQAQTPTKATVIFQPHASAAEIDVFATDWSSVGVTSVMALPFINGMVLNLPESVTVAEIAADPLVVSISGDYVGDLLAIKPTDEGASLLNNAIRRVVEELEGLQSDWWFWDRPRGVLSLYGMSYDPAYLMDEYQALEMLGSFPTPLLIQGA